MAKTKVLLVGGAGYIGSATAFYLHDLGYDVHILDNLSKGYRELIVGLPFHELDVHDSKGLDELFSSQNFEAVIHFAAYIAVGESVALPLDYYWNNVAGTVSLLKSMQRHEMKKLVFSSTAAVYGEPEQTPITESHSLSPINPYGWSKRLMEQALIDCDKAWGLSFAALRYFNASGADPEGRTGEWHRPETHLIPLALKAAVDDDSPLSIFGNDYPTNDGSAVRDYIHIVDLAEAHRLALEHLLDGEESAVFNLGSESGYSVFEVLRMVEQVSGKKVSYSIGPRREGDSAVLVASSAKIMKTLGWKRRRSDLERIVRDAWNWHREKGFEGPED